MKLRNLLATIFLFILIFLSSIPSFAQENVFAEKQILSMNQKNFDHFCTGDLDNDNDPDLITFFYVNGEYAICWHNNLDGHGNFGQQKFIYIGDNIFGDNSIPSFSVSDLDGDGDNDVIAYAESIYLFENLDGLGNFGLPFRIPILDNESEFTKIYCVDMDGDEDLDIFALCMLDPNVVWFENTDGDTTFEHMHSVFDENFVTNAFCNDMDGDGDTDVIIKRYSDNTNLFWVENMDGLGSFESTHEILPSGEEYQYSQFSCNDIDSDGDIDILAASNPNHDVIWLENTDGLGHFGRNPLFTNSTLNLTNPVFTDIDSDNDTDLLFCSRLEFRLICFKNLDGHGGFDDDPQTVLLNTHPSA